MNVRWLLALPAVVLPAFALPASAGIPVLGTADLWIDSRTATSATFCATGHVDDPVNVQAVWTLTVTGVRVAGLPIAQAAPIVTAPTLSKTCTTVFTNSTAAGTGVATVNLAAVGTSDVTAVCQLAFEWGITTSPNEVTGYCTDNAPGL